jgi:hypothetical protein
LKALLLCCGAQLTGNAAPGFALAANRSVTVGADTAANRPSFFNNARRCLDVVDFAVVACVLSFLLVSAIRFPSMRPDLLSRDCYPRRALIGKADTLASAVVLLTGPRRILKALLLGAQLTGSAAPGFALAAKRSVTVGADTAANRPSFFKSARRCLAVADFAAAACVLSLLPVLAMWSPDGLLGGAETTPAYKSRQ